MPDGGTCQLVSDEAGGLWFAKGNQIGVIRDGRFVKLSDTTAQRLVAARAGGVWIYTGTQLLKFTEAGGLTMAGDLPVSRPNKNATVLYEDRTGAVWIGTRENGLFRYDGEGFTGVKTSHHEIVCVTEDREGNLWVGTRGGGLNRLQPRVLELVDVGSGLAAEAVRSVCQDTAGDLWAVTLSGGVSRRRDDVWESLSARAGWPVPYAQCVTADPRGGVWFGTQYKGVFGWRDGVQAHWNRTNGLAGQSVRALLATPAGDLWIGTEASNALHRLRDGKLQTFDLPAGSGFVTAMTLDAAGDFWAGTADGWLLTSRAAGLVSATARTLTPPESVRCLAATPDGSLWIRPPHSPTPVPVLTVSGAAGAKANSLQSVGSIQLSAALFNTRICRCGKNRTLDAAQLGRATNFARAAPLQRRTAIPAGIDLHGHIARPEDATLNLLDHWRSEQKFTWRDLHERTRRRGVLHDVTHAEDTEAEGADVLLCTLDHRERVRRDRRPPRDARTQARLRRRIRGRQTDVARKPADLRLREPGVAQRREHMEFCCCDATGTLVLHVVGIFAIRDRRISARTRKRIERLEEFRFAKIAAIRRVRGVVGIFEFLRLHHFNRRADRTRERDRFRERLTRQARAVRDDSEHAVAEFTACLSKQECAVHAAAVRDDERRMLPEQFVKPGAFCRSGIRSGRCRCVHADISAHFFPAGNWSFSGAMASKFRIAVPRTEAGRCRWK